MTKHRAYMIVQTALIVLLVALLSAAAIRIFLEGDAIQRNGDLFYWIYTRDRVAERFAPIAPQFFIAIALTVAGRLLGVNDARADKPVQDSEIARDLVCARVQKPSDAMRRERAAQKRWLWGGWIAFGLCMLPVLLYCLNGAHFDHPNEGADGEFLNLMRVFLPWVAVGFGCLCVSAALRGRSERREAEAAKIQIAVERAAGVQAEPRTLPCKAVKQRPSKGVAVARYAVLALAVGLIIAGILNGGMADVLAKATSICMECVGLG